MRHHHRRRYPADKHGQFYAGDSFVLSYECAAVPTRTRATVPMRTIRKLASTRVRYGTNETTGCAHGSYPHPIPEPAPGAHSAHLRTLGLLRYREQSDDPYRKGVERIIIYFWQGRDSSQDEKAAAALSAPGMCTMHSSPTEPHTSSLVHVSFY